MRTPARRPHSPGASTDAQAVYSPPPVSATTTTWVHADAPSNVPPSEPQGRSDSRDGARDEQVSPRGSPAPTLGPLPHPARAVTPEDFAGLPAHPLSAQDVASLAAIDPSNIGPWFGALQGVVLALVRGHFQKASDVSQLEADYTTLRHSHNDLVDDLRHTHSDLRHMQGDIRHVHEQAEGIHALRGAQAALREDYAALARRVEALQAECEGFRNTDGASRDELLRLEKSLHTQMTAEGKVWDELAKMKRALTKFLGCDPGFNEKSPAVSVSSGGGLEGKKLSKLQSSRRLLSRRALNSLSRHSSHAMLSGHEGGEEALLRLASERRASVQALASPEPSSRRGSLQDPDAHTGDGATVAMTLSPDESAANPSPTPARRRSGREQKGVPKRDSKVTLRSGAADAQPSSKHEAMHVSFPDTWPSDESMQHPPSNHVSDMERTTAALGQYVQSPSSTPASTKLHPQSRPAASTDTLQPIASSNPNEIRFKLVSAPSAPDRAGDISSMTSAHHPTSSYLGAVSPPHQSIPVAAAPPSLGRSMPDSGSSHVIPPPQSAAHTQTTRPATSSAAGTVITSASMPAYSGYGVRDGERPRNEADESGMSNLAGRGPPTPNPSMRQDTQQSLFGPTHFNQYLQQARDSGRLSRAQHSREEADCDPLPYLTDAFSEDSFDVRHGYPTGAAESWGGGFGDGPPQGKPLWEQHADVTQPLDFPTQTELPSVSAFTSHGPAPVPIPQIKLEMTDPFETFTEDDMTDTKEMMDEDEDDDGVPGLLPQIEELQRLVLRSVAVHRKMVVAELQKKSTAAACSRALQKWRLWAARRQHAGVLLRGSDAALRRRVWRRLSLHLRRRRRIHAADALLSTTARGQLAKWYHRWARRAACNSQDRAAARRLAVTNGVLFVQRYYRAVQQYGAWRTRRRRRGNDAVWLQRKTLLARFKRGFDALKLYRWERRIVGDVLYHGDARWARMQKKADGRLALAHALAATNVRLTLATYFRRWQRWRWLAVRYGCARRLEVHRHREVLRRYIRRLRCFPEHVRLGQLDSNLKAVVRKLSHMENSLLHLSMEHKGLTEKVAAAEELVMAAALPPPPAPPTPATSSANLLPTPPHQSLPTPPGQALSRTSSADPSFRAGYRAPRNAGVQAFESAAPVKHASAQIQAFESAPAVNHTSAQIQAFESAVPVNHASAQVQAFESAALAKHVSTQIQAVGSGTQLQSAPRPTFDSAPEVAPSPSADDSTEDSVPLLGRSGTQPGLRVRAAPLHTTYGTGASLRGMPSTPPVSMGSLRPPVFLSEHTSTSEVMAPAVIAAESARIAAAAASETSRIFASRNAAAAVVRHPPPAAERPPRRPDDFTRRAVSPARPAVGSPLRQGAGILARARAPDADATWRVD